MASVESSTAPRHATWLELFFDLIVVAGAGQLAHLLHGTPDWRDVGLYWLLFLAFWIAWVLFTMYGNVVGERVNTARVIIGMFGMAVMAAAVAGVHESDQKAIAFAAAYVYVRVLGSRFWGRREGRIALDLPIAQHGAGLVPWVVSFWVADDWRVWCWALGLAIDVAMLIFLSREDLEREVNERWARFEERFSRRLRGRDRLRPEDLTPSERRRHGRELDRLGGRMPEQPVLVAADEEHLSERLGLFVIVVLGEGVIQIVTAAGAIEWDRDVYVVLGCSFLLLVSLWWLALLRGDNGLPLLARGALPVRLSLALHCAFTGAVVALAIVLGEAVTQADGAMAEAQRLLAVGALAVALLVLATAAIASQERVSWVLGAVLPGGAVLVVLALLGGEPASVLVVPLLTSVALWPVAWRVLLERHLAQAGQVPS